MAYVYRHIRFDKNEPFYIGIGENKYRHSALGNRNPIWRRIVAKTEWVSEILFDNITWDFACQKEIEFIKLYGRIDRKTGTLANMTDGGDGNLGLVHSEEAIRKISESSKTRTGYWKGKKMPKEAAIKMSISKKGKPLLKAIGRKLSDNQKESVRKHSIGNKYHLGHKHSEESKKKISDGMKGRKAHNKKEVLQFSKSGELLFEYSSLNEAAAKTGYYSYAISCACSGKRNTIKKAYEYYKGYIWKFKSN